MKRFLINWGLVCEETRGLEWLIAVIIVALFVLLMGGCCATPTVLQNTHWAGHPIFGTAQGLTEDETLMVGTREDGVVVWKRVSPMQAKHYLQIK